MMGLGRAAIYARYAVNAVVSVLILAFLFTRIPFEKFIAIIGNLNAYLFLLSVLLGALSIFINALRWHTLLRYLGYEYSLVFISRLAFITLFFNIYLPGGVVGEAVRVAMLPERSSKEDRQLHLTRVTASVVTDKLAGLAGLMLLAYTGLIFCYRLLLGSKVTSIFLLFTLGVVFIFSVFYSRRVQSFIKKIFVFPLRILSSAEAALRNVADALYEYRKNYSVFNIVIPMSMLSHLCMICCFFLLARSIGIDISFLKLLLFVPIIEFVSALPISLGGAGVRESASILLFLSEGIPAAEAMSISLLVFAVVLLLGAAGGALFLLRRINRRQQESGINS